MKFLKYMLQKRVLLSILQQSIMHMDLKSKSYMLLWYINVCQLSVFVNGKWHKFYATLFHNL